MPCSNEVGAELAVIGGVAWPLPRNSQYADGQKSIEQLTVAAKEAQRRERAQLDAWLATSGIKHRIP